MAGFLRARQAGIQNDLSAGIAPGAFNPDELARYGINSQIRSVHPQILGHLGPSRPQSEVFHRQTLNNTSIPTSNFPTLTHPLTPSPTTAV